MINVLMPVVDKPEKFLNSAKEICNDNNVKLIIGVSQTISNVYDFKLPNAVVKIYDDIYSREEILNDFQTELLGDAVFIARKPFTREELYQFVNKKSQIVLCANKETNPIMKFFNKLWRKVVKLVFGVKLFSGDPSLIYFDESLGNVLTNINNLSYSTRVDRWRGITQDTVNTKEPKAKINYDKKTNGLILLFSILSIIIGATVTTLVCLFVNVNVLNGMLVGCLDFICLTTSILLLITFIFNREIGKKNIKKATAKRSL